MFELLIHYINGTDICKEYKQFWTATELRNYVTRIGRVYVLYSNGERAGWVYDLPTVYAKRTEIYPHQNNKPVTLEFIDQQIQLERSQIMVEKILADLIGQFEDGKRKNDPLAITETIEKIRLIGKTAYISGGHAAMKSLRDATIALDDNQDSVEYVLDLLWADIGVTCHSSQTRFML